MSIWTSPTISNYNATPPPDDGSTGTNNEVTWAGIKTKLADPIKSYVDATVAQAATSFGEVFLNSVSAHSANYTVVSGDVGRLLNCTNTITITLLAAASAGNGFNLAVANTGSGTVTVAGNGAELVGTDNTLILSPGQSTTILCDGSAWQIIAGETNSTTAASGYTRVTPTYCRANSIPAATGSWTALANGNHSIAAPSGAKLVMVTAFLTASTEASIAASDSGYTAWYDELEGPNNYVGKILAPVFGGNIYLIVANTSAGAQYVFTGYFD